MRIVGLGCCCYAAFVLQTSIAAELAIGPYVPQFLLLALVVAVLTLREIPGLVCAAGLGLLSDALAVGPLGSDVACYTTAAFGIQRLGCGAWTRMPVVLCLFYFVSIGAISYLSATLRAAIGGLAFDPMKCLDLATGSAGYTALLGGGLALLGSLFVSRTSLALPNPRAGALG